MEPGKVIATRFTIEQLARSGGMSEIYVARDQHTGQRVALKFLRTEDPSLVDRFEQEGVVLAKLEHPAIVKYVAHGRAQDARLFIAMEWLDGEDLSKRLEQGALSVEESIQVASRVALALAWAHSSGVVHRDIKPSNVFLPAGQIDQLKVLDFGIARLADDAAVVTGTGAIMGTPGYMAPEQVRGAKEVDARVDVFSLGCVLFECLTGRRPFLGELPMAILAKILFEEVPRLSEIMDGVPTELDWLLMRMLSKDPEARPQDGNELLEQLEHIALHAKPSANTKPPSRLSLREQRVVSIVLARSAVARTGQDAPSSTITLVDDAQRQDPLRAVVAPFGGQVEWLANGSLAVALSGRGSAPDQAVHAARCALELHAAGVDAPIIVATGRGVDVGERLPVGEAIDRAVRLLRECAPNGDQTGGPSYGIVLDDVTARLLDRRFEVVPRPGGGAELRRERDIEAARTVLGRSTPCVGRSRELATLSGIFNECVLERVSRVVLVTAPVGVGKSRLRQEFLRSLRQQGNRVEVWVARGDPISAGSPFGMIAPGIRRTAGIVEAEPLESARVKLRARVARHIGGADLDRVAEFVGELVGVPFAEHQSVQLREARRDPRLMGDQMQRAWEDLLVAECAAQPVLMVLEDLHWGDLPSVKFINSALRNLEDQPLMVVALARPDVHDVFPNLWTERGVQEIRLRELTRRACEMLIRAVLGEEVRSNVVTLLVKRSKGNAFYLEELMRAEAEGTEVLPGSLVAMVQARLQALPVDLRRVLRAASVFGGLFWSRGVASLLGGSSAEPSVSAALEALAARELIAKRVDRKFSEEDEYAFRHDVVQEATYAMLTEADRTLAHALAGEWLERVGERDALILAEHFERGAQPARAAVSYQRSAEHALEGNDFVQAVSRAERALGLATDTERSGALKALQAAAHLWEGNFAFAEARGMEAAAHSPPGSVAWFQPMAIVMEAAGKLGQYDAVEQRMREIDEVEPAPDASGEQVDCLASGATMLVLGGRSEAARTFTERLERRLSSETTPAPRAQARVHYLRGAQALNEGDPGRGLMATEACYAEFRNAGDARAACMVQADVGYACAQLGLYERAEKELRSSLATAERMGLQYVVAATQENLGLVLGCLDREGASEEARDLEQRAALAFRIQGDRRMEGSSMAYLALLQHRYGDFVEAEATARRAVEVVERIPTTRAYALAILGQVLLSQRRAAEAMGPAGEAMTLLESLGGIDEGETLVRLVYAEALANNDRCVEAERAATAARDRLLARAARIADPEWRRSFLERVPENVRTMALAQKKLSKPPTA